MPEQQIVFTRHAATALATLIAAAQPDKVFVLTDEQTHEHCLPTLCPELSPMCEIIVGAGDTHKTLDTLSAVWQALGDQHATRRSLLVNLGGGMVSDLGGFAAATFKRGIRFINVPTTLLAMVDAAVGGKTGINFGGLKNEIGAFAPAEAVVIAAQWLRTLDMPNLLSGYAEMLKHGLISAEGMLDELLAFDLSQPDTPLMHTLIEASVRVKQSIVIADPHERYLRKTLNLGHTVGHAFESFALRRNTPVLHGYAVAWGLICELYLSVLRVGFPNELLRRIKSFIDGAYGSFSFAFDCNDYDALYDLMCHDKKNDGEGVNFTLLKDVGSPILNQTADKETIFAVLDFYRECSGQ